MTHKRSRVQRVRWVKARNHVRELNRQQAAHRIRDLRKRVEHLFAEAKEWHGLRRARGRGLWCVQSQILLTAITQNLKRMAHVFHRHNPAGEAVMPSPLPETLHRFRLPSISPSFS
ncbi:transposase [Kroppenstedtia guangzhouensis]|uniref:transposase n=1 Tax=Kroppenstedtia guangzhouensis TaxID=1274356 RepID=UPI00166C6B72